MKARILEVLRENKGGVSGPALSQALGVSRVTIWKHIQKLKAHGYDIVSDARGYSLQSAPDLPFPWEIPGRESQIHYYPETDSTMTRARELARKGASHFTVAVAGSQTKGRGRLRRAWISDPGGLYFTIVLRPPIPPTLSYRFNFAASLCMVQSLRSLFQVDVGAKWPNDILLNHRKLCGMLSEMEAESDQVRYLSIGMGVNLNNSPDPREQPAISLKSVLGCSVSPTALLSDFLDRFEQRIASDDLAAIIAEWKPHARTLNQPVRIIAGDRVQTGLAVDVDDEGALLLRREDGTVERITYGDCFPRDW